jgi:Ca2+-transporting ATPase
MFAVTMAFTTLVFLQISIGMSVRSRKPLHGIGYFSNRKMLVALSSVVVLQVMVINIPFFNAVFETVPLDTGHWMVVIGAMLLFFVILEAEKMMRKRRVQ